MKKCPFCAEEIQDEAIKCRYCSEFLDGRPRTQDDRPWYFRTSTVVAAILCLTVLALPLVWFNPHYSRNRKIVISVVVLAATYLLGLLMAQTLKTFQSYYQYMM